MIGYADVAIGTLLRELSVINAKKIKNLDLITTFIMVTQPPLLKMGIIMIRKAEEADLKNK